MANEITSAVSVTGTKSGSTTGLGKTIQRDLSGSQLWANTQTIGTSAELIAFPGDLTTEGITEIVFYNEDSTNYVELSLDSFTNIFAKIPAGRIMSLLPPSGSPTIYARANTAAINLRMAAMGT